MRGTRSPACHRCACGQQRPSDTAKLATLLSVTAPLLARRHASPSHAAKLEVSTKWLCVAQVAVDVGHYASLFYALEVLPHPLSVAALSVPRSLLAMLLSSSRSKSDLPERMPTALVLAFASASILLLRADSRMLPETLRRMLGGEVTPTSSSLERRDSLQEKAGIEPVEPSSTVSNRRRMLVLLASLVPLLVALISSFSIPPRLLDRLPASISRVSSKRKRTTVDFVFAYYDEDLGPFNGMIDEMLHVPGMEHKHTRVIIYNKGETSPHVLADQLWHADEVHQLPNVGREGGTYLHHIIRNYGVTRKAVPTSTSVLFGDEAAPIGLADHTSFAQGHLAWIGVANERLRLFNDSTGYLHYAPYVPSTRGFDEDNKIHFPFVSSIYTLFTDTFCPPTPITTAWAAQFIVSKERILRNERAKYVEMRNLLEPGPDHWIIARPEATFEWGEGRFDERNPWLGHALERSWPFIFGCGQDGSVARDCGKFGVDPRVCQCHDWPIDPPAPTKTVAVVANENRSRDEERSFGIATAPNSIPEQ